MAIPNWYKILGIPENVTPDALKRLENRAQRQHHSDLHSSASQAEKDNHKEQLDTVLEGVSFLGGNGRKLLDAQLREERAEQARARAEEIRERNREEAERRGDADDLRRQFGSPAPPKIGARPPGTAEPSGPPPPKPPTVPPPSTWPYGVWPPPPFVPPPTSPTPASQSFPRPAPTTTSGSDSFATTLTYIGVLLFVIAPWLLINATGLAKNTNAWGQGNMLAALVMIVLGLWGIVSIGIVVCVVGYLAFAGIRLLLGSVFR